MGLPAGQLDNMRDDHGGNIQPIPRSTSRWYQADIETAELEADNGRLERMARLMRWARSDGTLAGVLSTRTGGLVRLPRRFRGADEIKATLELGHGDTASAFDTLCPSAELELLAADGVLCGVGVGELVDVPGLPFRVFVRLDPEFLLFDWSQGQWYFRSFAGLVPITPGDGQWVLHRPGGVISPWQHGLWRAVGQAAVRKSHANAGKDNWEAILANPARVAYAPHAATQEEHESWFQRVLAWGFNTVFGLKPGYDVKLLESNGRGYESFASTISECNNEMIKVIAGQTVTTDGGTGFANADIHKSIRADLIKATADALAHTVNTQILPGYVVSVFGEDALLAGGAVVEWDVTPPHDRATDANALVATAGAIKTLTEALAVHNLSLDVRTTCERFGVPVSEAPPSPAALRLVVDNTQPTTREGVAA